MLPKYSFLFICLLYTTSFSNTLFKLLSFISLLFSYSSFPFFLIYLFYYAYRNFFIFTFYFRRWATLTMCSPPSSPLSAHSSSSPTGMNTHVILFFYSKLIAQNWQQNPQGIVQSDFYGPKGSKMFDMGYVFAELFKF